jgi:hypothetical protein
MGNAWETPMKGPDPPEAKVVVDSGMDLTAVCSRFLLYNIV